MSAHSMHLAKRMPALEQVTVMHLVKCLIKISKVYQIYNFSERHLAKWHIVALTQVIAHTDV